MAVTFVDLNARYIPKTNDKPISVLVEIGNGQNGSYVIFLGQKKISTDSPGTIGTKSDIGNQKTIIAATIVDELEETNWTSIIIKITEDGQETVLGPYEKQAENHLDTILYSLCIVHS